MIKAFLDTSVILGKILGYSKDAETLFSDPDVETYTNDYVLKELYHVLKRQHGFSEMQISYVFEYIRKESTVLPSPSKEELSTIKLKDNADRPIVLSAYKHGLVLYIDDEVTYNDAKRYVTVVRVGKDGSAKDQSL